MSKENYTQEEAKESLIKDVIQNIVEDIENEDHTSIYALLNNVPLEDLIEFLPEKEGDLYEIIYVQEKRLKIKQDG